MFLTDFENSSSNFAKKDTCLVFRQEDIRLLEKDNSQNEVLKFIRSNNIDYIDTGGVLGDSLFLIHTLLKELKGRLIYLDIAKEKANQVDMREVNDIIRANLIFGLSLDLSIVSGPNDDFNEFQKALMQNKSLLDIKFTNIHEKESLLVEEFISGALARNYLDASENQNEFEDEGGWNWVDNENIPPAISLEEVQKMRKFMPLSKIVTHHEQYSLINNPGGGDCGVYSTRDALKNASILVEEDVVALRLKICQATKKIMDLRSIYDSYKEAEEKFNKSGVTDDSSYYDPKVVLDSYKSIFNGDFNILKPIILDDTESALNYLKSNDIPNFIIKTHELFKKFLKLEKINYPAESDLNSLLELYNNHKSNGDESNVVLKDNISLHLKYLKEKYELQDTLQTLKQDLEPCVNWNSAERLGIIKRVFDKDPTFDIGTNGIFEDHNVNPPLTKDTYYAYASKSGIWVNSFEINAYLLSRGIVFKESIIWSGGTILKYKSTLDDREIYLHNNGVDLGNGFARGSHWQAARANLLSEEYQEFQEEKEEKSDVYPPHINNVFKIDENYTTEITGEENNIKSFE